MPTQNIVLKYIADVDDIKKKLLATGNFTEKQALATAKRMANIQQKEYLKQQKKVKQEGKKQGTLMASGFSAGFAGVAAGAAAALGAIAATAGVVRAWKDMGQEVADFRNTLNDTASETGLAAEQLQGLKLAATHAGFSFSELIPAFRNLPKRMEDFSLGAGDAKIAFEKLGFTAADLTKPGGGLKETSEIVPEIISRLRKMESTTDRAAAASRIFGRSGTKLNAIFADRSLEEWVNVAERFGIDIGPEASKQAADWERTMALFNLTVERTKGELVDAAMSTGVLKVAATSTFAVMQVGIHVFEQLTEKIRGMAQIVNGDWKTALKSAAMGGVSFTGVALNLASKMEDIKTFWSELSADVKNKPIVPPSTGKGSVKDATKDLEKYQKAIEAFRDAYQSSSDDIVSEDQRIIKSGEERKNKLVAQYLEILAMGTITDAQQAAAHTALMDSLEAIDERTARNRTANREQEAADRLAIEEGVLSEIQSAEDAVNSAILQNEDEKKEAFRRTVYEIAEVAAQAHQIINDIIAQSLAMEMAASQAALDQNRENLDQLKDARREVQDQLAGDIDERTRQRLESNLEILNSEIQTGKETSAAQKEILKKAWKADKALKISQAVIATALAIVQQIASMPGPAGWVSSGLAAVAGAASVATIAAEPMPQFHAGFAGFTSGPDEQPAMLSQGEAVLNKRAAQGLGRDTIDGLNSGTGGGSPVFVINFQGRTIDALISRTLDQGGNLSRRIAPPSSGMIPVYEGS